MTVPPPSAPIYDADTVPLSGEVGGAPRGSSRGRGNSFEAWVAANSRALGAVGVALVVVVGGGMLWRASGEASAARAERALYEAESRYTQGDPGAAAALRQVNARYADTPAGAHARLLLAQAEYDQGRYAEGVRVLDSRAPNGDWVAATRRLRAVGLIGSGRALAGAKDLEALAKEAGPDERVSLLGDAARAYETAADTSDARRVWAEVVGAGVRGLSDEARVRLGELVGQAK